MGGSIMNELYIELTFLLGLKYLQENFSILYNDQAFTEVLVSTECKFISKIRKMIRKLLKLIDLQFISNSLQSSASFLLLLKKRSKKSGLCLICDKYFEKLKDHLTIAHRLTYNYFRNYKSLFGHQAESFFPSVLQRQEPLSVEPDVYIVENEKKPSKSEPKSKRILKNIAANKPNVNPYLYYLAEKYVDTIAQKDFFKEKINANNQVKGKKKSESGKETRASGVCETCKVPVKDKDWNMHILSHNSTELVLCPLCINLVNKRYLSKHKRRCSKKNSVNRVNEILVKSGLNANKCLPVEPVVKNKKNIGDKSGNIGSRPQGIIKNNGVNKSNFVKKAENYMDLSVNEKSSSNSDTEDDTDLVRPEKDCQDIESCQICNVSVPGEEWLNHIRTHVVKKSNNCPLCYKTFDLRSYLTKHLKRHDKKRLAEKAY